MRNPDLADGRRFLERIIANAVTQPAPHQRGDLAFRHRKEVAIGGHIVERVMPSIAMSRDTSLQQGDGVRDAGSPADRRRISERPPDEHERAPSASAFSTSLPRRTPPSSITGMSAQRPRSGQHAQR